MKQDEPPADMARRPAADETIYPMPVVSVG